MKITIGFSRSKSPWKIGSKLIQIAEKREFSHAFIMYKCPITQVELVTQASHGRINEVNYKTFKEHNVIVKQYILECTPAEFNNILVYNKTHMGTLYSQWQIFVIGLAKLFKYKKEIYVDGEEKNICSEWVARLASFVGYLIGLPKVLDALTPSDLENLMSMLAERFPQKIEVKNG